MNLHRLHCFADRVRPAGRAHSVALLICATVIVGALPCGAVASQPRASATLSVDNSNSSAAELLRRLTIPQLATALKTTPAQLALGAQAGAEAAGGSANVELTEALNSPTATLQEVLALLAAHGVSTAPLQEALDRLLAGGGESGERLRSVIDSVLADLAEGGTIGALANELGVPRGLVEGAQFTSSTVERSASSLGTTSSNLASTLTRAGAATRPIGRATPVAAAPLDSGLRGASTLLLGLSNGSGGVSLTTVSSSAPAPATAAARPGPSNAFSIVSIRVTRSGAIVETVRLPGPGRLSILATAKRKVVLRSRLHTRAFTRRATVASAATNAPGGINTLTLHARGVARLASRIVLGLATTYTPTGGSPNTIQRSVTIRRVVKKRNR